MGLRMGFGARMACRAALVVLLTVVWAHLGHAATEHIVAPHDWELGFQEAGTPVKERIAALNHELLVIITLITLLVLSLLGYVMLRFNARRNPVPSRTSHNTLIELLWTVIPVLILVTIAIPSFKLMYYMDRTQKAEMTVKVTGHQWYWSYDYPDYKNVSFDSNIIPEKQIKPGQLRLLEVDNRLVVPVKTNIRILVTGTDVIHSWFVPSLGVQEYAIVGRLNESWMNIERPGIYYGECNQLCGVNHAFMPIAVEAVSKDDFKKWIAAKEKTAAADEKGAAPARLVAAAAPVGTARTQPAQ